MSVSQQYTIEQQKCITDIIHLKNLPTFIKNSIQLTQICCTVFSLISIIHYLFDKQKRFILSIIHNNISMNLKRLSIQMLK